MQITQLVQIVPFSSSPLEMANIIFSKSIPRPRSHFYWAAA